MKITLISVGKIKDKYFVSQITDHIKSLKKHVQIEVIEVPDEKCPEKLSDKEMIQVKNKEGERILQKVPHASFVIVLAIDGKQLSSAAFYKQMSKWGENIVFIIGGSLGLSDDVIKRAKFKLSFSKMTFPHQLMKVMLLEQIDDAVATLSRR